MTYVRSVLFVVIAILFTVPLTTMIVLCSVLPMSWRIFFSVLWRKCFMAATRGVLGIQTQVIGRENLPAEPVVILSKHQSAWETVALQEFFAPTWLVFVLKKELLYVPFIGWALAAVREISIDRKAGLDALEQVVEQGRNRLQRGYSVVIFPEGTRVAPGTRRRYKGGGAHLAVRTGYKVVPVAHNAGELWPRNAFLKHAGTVTVSIGPAIETAGKTSDQVIKATEAWIEAEMQRISPHLYKKGGHDGGQGGGQAAAGTDAESNPAAA